MRHHLSAHAESERVISVPVMLPALNNLTAKVEPACFGGSALDVLLKKVFSLVAGVRSGICRRTNAKKKIAFLI